MSLPGLAGIRGFAGASSGFALADTLSDLYANSELGDWWVGNNVYTDAASAGANVTTATGVVNGLTCTRGDVTKTPVLEASGSNFGIRFNGSGSGQRLVHNFGADLTQPGTMWICLLSSNTLSHIYLTGSSSTKRWQLSANSSGSIVSFAGASQIDSGINTPIGATAKVFLMEYNGASSKIFMNDASTPLVTGNLGTAVTNQITVASVWDGTASCNCLVFAWGIINRLLTTGVGGERDRAMRAAGALAGVTW